MTYPVEGYARVLTDAARAAIDRALPGDDAVMLSAADVPQQFEPPQDYARTARRLAEQSCDQVDQLLPAGLVGVLEGVDLRAALTARLTLRLFLEELPPLQAFLARPDLAPTVVVVDSGLTDGQVRGLLEAAHVRGSGGRVIYTRTPVPRLPRFSVVRARLAPVTRARPPQLPVGGTLGVCGSDTDLAFLAPMVGVGDVVLAKNDRKEAARACAVLAAAGATIVEARTFAGMDPGRRRRRAAHKALRALPRSVRAGGLGSVVAELEHVVHSALSFSALCDLVQPQLVVGALERSLFGGLASVFQHSYGYRAVNVQHGTVLPACVMDLLKLDACLAWNQWSVEAYRKDGFRGRALIVGNPRWDQLRQERSAALGSMASVAAWKAQGPLIVAFPQPERGPYLTESSIRRFAEVLRRLLERRPDVRLLVKERSRSPARIEREVLAGLEAVDQVRFMAATEVSLAGSLAHADLAVSIYSTALADAVAAGVCAVSVDPDAFVATLGLDFLSVIPRCQDADELERELDSATQAGRAPDSSWRAVFPPFDAPYAERVAAALDETVS